MTNQPSRVRLSAHTVAVAGCRVAALVVLAAAVLWVVNPAMREESLMFCRAPIDAVTTLWDRTYLRAPFDERCAVEVGPRTVAAGMAAGGMIGLAVMGVPLWLPRPGQRASGPR